MLLASSNHQLQAGNGKHFMPSCNFISKKHNVFAFEEINLVYSMDAVTAHFVFISRVHVLVTLDLPLVQD